MDGQFCKSWSGWCWEAWKWSLPKKKALSFERLVRFEWKKCANRYSHMATKISSFSVKLEMYLFIHRSFSKQQCFFSVVVVVVVASKRQRWRVRTRAGDHWSFAQSIFMETSHKSMKFWTSGDSIRDLLIPQLRSPTALYVFRVTKNCQDSKFFFRAFSKLPTLPLVKKHGSPENGTPGDSGFGTITFFLVPMVGECFMGSIDGWVGDLASTWRLEKNPSFFQRHFVEAMDFPPDDSYRSHRRSFFKSPPSR